MLFVNCSQTISFENSAIFKKKKVLFSILLCFIYENKLLPHIQKRVVFVSTHIHSPYKLFNNFFFLFMSF